MNRPEGGRCWPDAAIAAVCDHTFLNRTEAYRQKAAAGESAIALRQSDFYRFLEETLALPHRPYALCVRAEDVPHARRYLEAESRGDLPIAATVGFPEGGWYPLQYKLFETRFSLDEGAREIDLVMDYAALKEGRLSAVADELETIAGAVHSAGALLKVILEVSALEKEQIITACRLAAQHGADFVKTATGFGSRGATLESVECLLRNFAGGVKISGGVNRENVQDFLNLALKVRGNGFRLDPRAIRIGESSLLVNPAAVY